MSYLYFCFSFIPYVFLKSWNDIIVELGVVPCESGPICQERSNTVIWRQQHRLQYQNPTPA